MIDTILLALILFFLLVLCYCVQKGFNEVVTGLNAIHEQLRKLGEKK